MPILLKKALSLITGNDQATVDLKLSKKFRPFKKLTLRELIQLESEVGRELFGEIPKGHQREFFHLENDTWIWHEEYKDENGIKHSSTTRYEVQERGVLKAQDGAQYSYLEGDELRNFVIAVQMYYEQVARKVYNRDPHTGQELPQ